MDEDQEITLEHVAKFLYSLPYSPTIHTKLNELGINPSMLYLNKNFRLSKEQKQKFMLLVFEYS